MEREGLENGAGPLSKQWRDSVVLTLARAFYWNLQLSGESVHQQS